MGRQKDGTVIPTPRDRVIDSESNAIYETILNNNPDKFEIVYSDGSVVFGTSIADWVSAPSTEVQFVIVGFADGGYAYVCSMEAYNFKGQVKTGPWLDDNLFFDMRDNLQSFSAIMQGV